MSIMAAATLTATSVGITARVLADLGHLRTQEGQIILGAALIDDVLGLLLLTIIEGFSRGRARLRGHGDRRHAGRALGFLLAATIAGRWLVPVLFRLTDAHRAAGHGHGLRGGDRASMAWLADRCGSAMIIGAFAAGLMLVAAPAGPRDRAGDHGARPFLRPDLLRLGRGIGRPDRPESARSREPAGTRHGRRPDRGRHRRQARWPAMRRSGSGETRRSSAWA